MCVLLLLYIVRKRASDDDGEGRGIYFLLLFFSQYLTADWMLFSLSAQLFMKVLTEREKTELHTVKLALIGFSNRSNKCIER